MSVPMTVEETPLSTPAEEIWKLWGAPRVDRRLVACNRKVVDGC